MKNNKSLTWITFNNLIPIITSLVIMTLAFAKLQMDIALLNQKVDNVIVLLEKSETRQANIIINLNDLNKRLVTVETEHEINRR